MSLQQRITPDQVLSMPGQPGVTYILDRPPYTMYAWNGSQMNAMSSDAVQSLASQGRKNGAAGYEVYGPGNTQAPVTFVSSSNVSVGPTATAVTIDGEEWLRINWTGSAGGASSVNLAFHTPMTYPVNCDTAVVEYSWAEPFRGYVGLNIGAAGDTTYANGTNGARFQMPNSGSGGNSSSPVGLEGRQALVFTRERLTSNKGVGITGAVIQAPIDICRVTFTSTTTSTAGQAFVVYLRSVRLGGHGRKGRLCIVWDDGERAALRGAAILSRYGIPSTLAIIQQAAVNADSLSPSAYAVHRYLNTRDTRAFVDAGNFAVAHGSNNGSTNLYTAPFGATDSAEHNAARIADMNLSRDYLVRNGLTDARGAACYVWPKGIWNAAKGETSLLDAAYKAGYRLGRSATLFPSNAAINYPGNPVMLHNIRAMSPRSHARLILSPIGHANSLNTINETANITQLTDVIFPEIANSGLDGFLMLHKTVSPGGSLTTLDIETDRLETLAAAIATQVTAGKMECVGMPELVDPAHLA